MKKGFTLLEILIVIIIIAILATFAIPQYIRAAKRAIASEAISVIGSIKGALARYYQENGDITTNLDDLDIDNPNSVTGHNFTYTISGTGIDGYTITAQPATTRAKGITVTYQAASNSYEVCYDNRHLAGSNLGTCGGG
jgi:type IV pilus assembly protein PilA